MSKVSRQADQQQLYNALVYAWTKAGKPLGSFEFTKPGSDEVQTAKVADVSGAGIALRFVITSIPKPVVPEEEVVLKPEE